MDAQLRELCDEFEQVMLVSLVPAPSGAVASESSPDQPDDTATGAALTSELFPQVFAAALERAGGVGLGAAFFRALGGRT